MNLRVLIFLLATTLPVVARASDTWEYKVVKDKFTDKNQATIYTFDTDHKALFQIICEGILKDGTPAYYFHVTTAQFLGETDAFAPRTTELRVDDDPPLTRRWSYADKTAGTEDLKSETHELKEIVDRLANGSRLRIRLNDFRYRHLDLDFRPTKNKSAFGQFLTECQSRKQ